MNEEYTENAYLNVVVPKSRKWRFYLTDKNGLYIKVKWPITVCIQFSVLPQKMSPSRSYPVSVINHNTIIPKNNARYHETFNTVIMPRDNVYKITSITCKIDTTSLWNIRSTNVVKVMNNQGYEMIYNVGGGHYTIDELCNAIAGSIAINEDNQAYVVSENAQSVDLSGASDIANILKLEGVLTPPAVATEPYDITNGMSVIRVYSSINAQTFGLKSPLIENLIHVSMGLNNMIT